MADRKKGSRARGRRGSSSDAGAPARQVKRRVAKAVALAEAATAARDNPEGVVARVAGKRPTLEELFPGPGMSQVRDHIVATGVYRPPGARHETRVVTRPRGDGQHEVLQMTALRRADAVPRNPGTVQDLLDLFDDYAAGGSALDKAQEVEQHWTIYNNDGLVNAAVNKIAALMATGGRFKVRHAKKGKKQKAREELQAILDEVNENVNNAPADGVVTGARGLKMVTQQAVRQCLVEGDWIGRTVWANHEVRGVGKYSLPMIIQSISMANVEPIDELAGTGLEAWYWVPDRELVRQLTSPSDPIIRDLLKRYVDSKSLAALKKDGKVFIDPALLLHVKHRGVYHEIYGESFIKPALYAVAYKKAVEQLDLVTINSLINRLTIVMVGSSDPQSPYADPAVASARQQEMQQHFEDPGPNMTVVWQGDDVEVIDVGAHSTVMSLDGRHVIGDTMKKTALGIPDALLTGSSADGKSSAFASMLSAGSTLDETQSAFEQVYTTLGNRIAEENGFTEADIIYEFDNSMMLDRTEERNQARNDYIAGGMSIRSYVASRGQDPDAEFRQRCVEQGLDPETTLWRDAFKAPQGLPGQGTTGGPPGQENRNPGGGRTPDSVQGKPATPPTEKKTPVENK